MNLLQTFYTQDSEPSRPFNPTGSAPGDASPQRTGIRLRLPHRVLI